MAFGSSGIVSLDIGLLELLVVALRGEVTLDALLIDRAACRRFAEGFSWEACTREFERNLEPIPPAVWDALASR